MKAITLWQPWASLIATGAKIYETRSWATRYRGPIAIHAATKKHLSDLTFYLSSWAFQGGLAPLVGHPLDLTFKSWPGVKVEDLPYGAIVATAELVDCVKTDDLTLGQIQHDQHFGNFAPGRYAWKLENVKPLPTPIPAKGKQGLWDWNDE